MKIDLAFTYEALKSLTLNTKVIVTIDVLRATTTMTTALYHNDLSIIPVREIEKAVELKRDDPNSLLCGERNGEIIPGFDKGNSPFEYQDITSSNLIFSSTNGSQTIEKAKQGKTMYLAAIINAKTVANHLVKNHQDDEILFACSGKLGKSCIEDTICAGYLISMIQEQINPDLDDSSTIARDFYQLNQNNIFEKIANSEHGKYLADSGYVEDIKYCTQKDLLDIIAVYDKTKSKIIKL